MKIAMLLAVSAIGVFAQTGAYVPPKTPPPYRLSEEETAAVRAKMAALNGEIGKLGRVDREMLADVVICHKAAAWILRHPEEFLTRAYYENTLKALDLGLERARELAAGKASWPERKGRTVRAYWSQVDGSVQPYMVIVPGDYDGARPMRLDLVLHGRNARLNEVSFIADAEWGKPVKPEPGRIEMHVYGRTNNAYRWAGEADVFEALASVEKRYRIDPSRIVLRGFSMGGAGAWHLGLHYPDRWAAIEAGAGFSETLRYAKAAGAPAHEKGVWPIYDAYLYARNALHVPTVGYGSVDDPQIQASLNVKEQLGREEVPPSGLGALFLTGPKIGHKFAPESKAESEAFILKAMAAGRAAPDHIRFLTYTARYGKCYWLRIEGLERHYERGEVDAVRQDGLVRVATKGVTRLSLQQPSKVELDGQPLEGAAFEKRGGKWAKASGGSQLAKRPGLQGPIDDAFLGSFLCVRPTGKAKDPAAHEASLRRLKTFQADWDKFFRGDVRVKDDTAVTSEDIRNHHLVLFGDAGSNKWMAKVLPKIPMKRKAGAGEVPVAIYPNPLNPSKYVVVNSGHTFNEAHLRGTNTLLYPRLGDWAVLDANGGVVEAGFFDENWR